MRALALLALLLLAAPAARAENPVVRFATPMGSFDVELCQETSALCAGAAPNTVANFLGYVDSGAYVNSFVHRVAFDFVIQGGSFTDDGEQTRQICPADTCPKIDNEFNQPNVRGSISVPLAGGDIDSGTSGWFVNVSDNSATGGGTNLDAGSFTVFGHVIGDGMGVVDAINGAFRLALGFTSGFDGTPVTPDYVCNPNQGGACTNDPFPFLVFTDVQRAPEPAAGGLAAAAALALLARRRPRAR